MKKVNSVFPSPSGDIVCLTWGTRWYKYEEDIKFPSPSGDIVCLTQNEGYKSNENRCISFRPLVGILFV